MGKRLQIGGEGGKGLPRVGWVRTATAAIRPCTHRKSREAIIHLHLSPPNLKKMSGTDRLTDLSPQENLSTHPLRT
jgi:hypothetical protein